MPLRTLLPLLLSAATLAPVPSQVPEPERANVLPGGVRLLSAGGSSKGVKVPEGASGAVILHYHNAAGAGTTRRAKLSPQSSAPGWTFKVDFDDVDPVGPCLISIDITADEGVSAAVPVLRRQELDGSTKSGYAHPYRYANLWLQTRLLSDARLAPLRTRLALREIDKAGVDTAIMTHGTAVHPVEIFLEVGSHGVVNAREGTLHQETADYFASDDLIGLGGKFIEIDTPSSRFQVYLNEPASIWGHWIGSDRGRKFEPTHWKFAYETDPGQWEVAAEGQVDRNYVDAAVSKPNITLSMPIALPTPATRVMFVAFSRAHSPKPLGNRPTCPVELPK